MKVVIAAKTYTLIDIRTVFYYLYIRLIEQYKAAYKFILYRILKLSFM